MADPIQRKLGALIPTGDTPPVSSNAPVAPAAPGVAKDAVLLQDGAPRWTPTPNAEEAQVLEAPGNNVSPTLEAKVASMMSGIVAPRAQATQAAPPQILFDPKTAASVGDGSLVPPNGRANPGAPAPGKGAVTPPGLANGNSVFRYGANGSPANFTILDQGSTNGCGTTSLAMLLNFLAGGKPYDRPRIDASIRALSPMFTSPGDIAAYAEGQGLEASLHDETTIDDLHGMIDQGLPVEVLLDVSDKHDGSGLHYELVTGYGTGPDGKPYVELANPWGKREYMPEAAFLERWSNLSLKGIGTSINRVAITVKPADSRARLLPDQRNNPFDTTMSALRVAQGVTQVTNGIARRDLMLMAEGVVRGWNGLLAGIPALLGYNLRHASQDWLSHGMDKLKHPGSAPQGVGMVLAGAAGMVVAAPIEVVGNALSFVGELAARGVHALRGLFH